MTTIIVNLFGQPGAGKSTGAAYIFSQLKLAGVDVELITEFAKDKVWEENAEVFKNQAYIFGKQFFKLSRCDGKVGVLVTDSPLPLSILYNHEEHLTENFNRTVMDVFNSFHNMNYLLTRVKPYNPNGRHQTEKESDKLGEEIIKLLRDRGISYEEATGDTSGYDKIIKDILYTLNKQEV